MLHVVHTTQQNSLLSEKSTKCYILEIYDLQGFQTAEVTLKVTEGHFD